MLEKIDKVCDEFVRPSLLKHYGDIKLLSFEDGILRFKLLGQCSGCPSAKYTVEDIIAGPLMENVPEIKQVMLENTVSDELIGEALKFLKRDK